MLPSSISNPVEATVLTLYARGGKHPFASKIHQCTGELSVIRVEGRYGTLPALQLTGHRTISLFEPRIVDMVSGDLEIQGLERTSEGDWVAQAWRIRFGKPGPQ